MIYLASPYTHPNPTVRERRYDLVCEAAAAIMRTGREVYSPIAHSHGLVRYGVPVEWPFWRAFDRLMIGRCSTLWVLLIDGWEQSTGVREEVVIARQRGIPIRYVTLECLLDEARQKDAVASCVDDSPRRKEMVNGTDESERVYECGQPQGGLRSPEAGESGHDPDCAACVQEPGQAQASECVYQDRR